MTSLYCSTSFRPQDSQPSLHSPVILNDSLDLPDAVAWSSSPDGLSASRDLRIALLSMSGYEKPQNPEFKGYETSRPSDMYLDYGATSYAQPHVRGSLKGYPRHPDSDQVPYEDSALLEPRAHFGDSNSAYQGHQLPTITSYTPQDGPEGTAIYIYFCSVHDLGNMSSLKHELTFAGHQCLSELASIGQDGSYYKYILTATAPPFSNLRWMRNEVPVRLSQQTESGIEVGTVEVGSYTYTSPVQQVSQVSLTTLSRKRKNSTDSSDSGRLPTSKRPTVQQLQTAVEEPYQAHVYNQRSSPVYMQPPSPVTESAIAPLAPYDRPSTQGYYQQPTNIERRTSNHLSNGSGSSNPQLRAPSPPTPAWSPSNIASGQVQRSPNQPMPAATRVYSNASPLRATINPPLIRTSTLQQQPASPATSVGTPASTSFNPYKMYPHKAVLKIEGDLDSMTEEWSGDELESKRRLVQFSRSQSGNTITTNFAPVAVEDRQQNSICISCIWWEAKNDYYVTSVDTIYLLESLVSVRFTVEEKNRIRRNLEGFRPLTVSKGKPDSEDFFKLIMGFPNPKPRNIEKDVKVFPWRILAHALKKIISKYSASYSSTAGELHHPDSSYSQSLPSEGTTDDLSVASPRSIMTPARGAYTATALMSNVVSPHISQNQGRLSNPYSSPGTSVVQVSMPSTVRNTTYAMPPTPYQYPTSNQMTLSSDSIQMMSQPRSTWDYSPFGEGSPATSIATHAQPIYYTGNGQSQHESPISHTHYRMTHTSSAP